MTRPKILDKIAEHGFMIFDDGNYDLNIIAVRNLQNTPNSFDDKLHVCYLHNGAWKERVYQVTTDAGSFYLEDPNYRNGEGVAIWAHPSQSRGSHKIGLHRGKYKALVQVQSIPYWRDKNYDNRADYGGEIHTNVIGLNVHRASRNLAEGSNEVNRHSAGCLVFSRNSDFQDFMALCENQVSSLGYRTFSVTMIAG